VEHAHTPHNTIERPHAKVLVSAIENQVLRGDTSGEVVDHSCNLACAWKHGK
jgi:hypothetical protein